MTSPRTRIRHSRAMRRMGFLLVQCLATAALIVSAQEDDSVCLSGTCLGGGETECDRTTGACPPCIYPISGGFSCYDEVDSACPFPDPIAFCDSNSSLIDASTASSSSDALDDSSRANKDTSSTKDSKSSDTPQGSVDEESGTSGSTDGPSSVALIVIIAAGSVGVLLIVIGIVLCWRRRCRARHDDDDYQGKTPQLGTHRNFAPTTLSNVQAEADAHVQRVDALRGTTSTSMAAAPSYQRLSHRINFSTLEGSVRNTNVYTHLTANDPATRSDSAGSRATTSQRSHDQSHRSHGQSHRSHGQSHRSHTSSADSLDLTVFDTTRAPSVRMPSFHSDSSFGSLAPSELQTRDFHDLDPMGSFIGSEISIDSERPLDDCDIVDSDVFYPGERRNTETLVAAGRFRQFSNASLAESEEETESFKEHEI